MINLIRDGVRSNADILENKETHNFPILPQGTTLSGQYYPLLFQPDSELGERRTEIPLAENNTAPFD